MENRKLQIQNIKLIKPECSWNLQIGDFLVVDDETAEKKEKKRFLAKPTLNHEKAIKKQCIFCNRQRREIRQWLPAQENV